LIFLSTRKCSFFPCHIVHFSPATTTCAYFPPFCLVCGVPTWSNAERPRVSRARKPQRSGGWRASAGRGGEGLRRLRRLPCARHRPARAFLALLTASPWGVVTVPTLVLWARW